MKKFTVPCDFNGVKSPFTIYVGSPKDDHHPIHFQSDWLSKERGGNVPAEVMDSLSQLRDISIKNGVSFEDLCVYALGAAQQEEEAKESTDDSGGGGDDNNNADSDNNYEEPDNDYDSSDSNDDQEANDDEIKVATTKVPASEANS
jgi:hypothetical protein